MDQVFAEKNRDENYLEKRKITTLIGVDCLKPCSPESICSRMGGLDPKGRFDLFLTDIGQAFLIEVATPRGEELASGIGKEAQKTDVRKLKAVRKKRECAVQQRTEKTPSQAKGSPEADEKQLRSSRMGRARKKRLCLRVLQHGLPHLLLFRRAGLYAY